MITVEGLQKRFGKVHALRGIDLHVEEGVVHGLIGPNGAGKSTTIKIISTLMRPDLGSVEVCGKRDGSRRSLIGVVPENPRLHAYHTGIKELLYVAGMRGMKKPEAISRIKELAEQLDFESMLDRRVSTYSTGTRKRIAIAAALMHGPEVLLLDEPMSGLDPIVRRQLKDLILGLDCTVLVSDHDLHTVEEVCQSVTIIKEGRTLVEDHIDALREKMGRLAVEIRVASDPQRLADTLEEKDFVSSVSSDSDSVLVAVPSALDIPRVVRAAADYDVVEVRQAQMSLEEVFLKYAEGEL